MSAEKLPKMPPVPKDQALSFGHTSLDLQNYAEAYGRACYLAGLAAAREAVPAEGISAKNQIDRFGQGQFNRCRGKTLANITALEKEAGK